MTILAIVVYVVYDASSKIYQVNVMVHSQEVRLTKIQLERIRRIKEDHHKHDEFEFLLNGLGWRWRW